MIRIATMTAVLLALACSPSQQAHPRPQKASAVTSAELSGQDRDFIEKAAEGNNGEEAIGALVNGRSENGGVLQFGRMMVADHGAAQGELAAIAKERAIALPSSLGDHQEGFDKLVDLEGEAFDREFVKVMTDDHNKAVLLYRSEASGGIDPLLKQYAATMLPKIEAHLVQAKALADLASPPP